jgi:predicted Zn-dependent protease with MMP-like domain
MEKIPQPRLEENSEKTSSRSHTGAFKTALLAGLTTIGAISSLHKGELSLHGVEKEEKYDIAKISSIDYLDELFFNSVTELDAFSEEEIKNQENIIDISKTDSIIESKKRWMVEYLHSPKYKERLKKEFIESGYEEKIVDENLDRIIAERIQNIEKGKVILISESELKEEDKNTYGYYVTKGMSENEIVDSTQIPGDVFLNKENFTEREGPATVIHEVSHQSTDGKFGLADNTIDEIEKRTLRPKHLGIEEEDRGYYRNPTEVKARIDVLRNLLQEEGIYNSSSEKFTISHVQLMLQNRKIMSSLDVQDLFLRCFNRVEDLLYAMNDIAKFESGMVKKEGTDMV